MPAVQRGEIEARAQRQIAAIEARYPRLAIDPHLENCPDEEIDQLVTEFADLPCPALQDDRTCALYDYRPITCRTMGIPTETAGTVQGACETQTFIPVVKLSDSLRAEEDRLAEKEAGLLRAGKWLKSFRGDEVLLPYGFVMESNRAS